MPVKPFNELKETISQQRDRINHLMQTLSQYFVGKDEIIEVICVSTASQEPLLLVGEPGTGKSDLIVKFCQAAGLTEEDYFEYMLTRFTEPSEIIGPVDVQELKEGKYLRRVEGKLPTAKVAFLDEIFQSNSAILNTLLTVVNEGKFYQDGRAVSVELKMLFGATNEIPPFQELAALKDRFPLKIKSPPVHEGNFEELLHKGVANEMMNSFSQRPWENLCDFDDFLSVKNYLDYIIFGIEEEVSGPQGIRQDIENYWDTQTFGLFRRILQALAKDLKVTITDRKVIKLYRLIRTRAFLLHGGAVRLEDLKLLRYVGDDVSQFDRIEEEVDRMISL